MLEKLCLYPDLIVKFCQFLSSPEIHGILSTSKSLQEHVRTSVQELTVDCTFIGLCHKKKWKFQRLRKICIYDFDEAVFYSDGKYHERQNIINTIEIQPNLFPVLKDILYAGYSQLKDLEISAATEKGQALEESFARGAEKARYETRPLNYWPKFGNMCSRTVSKVKRITSVWSEFVLQFIISVSPTLQSLYWSSSWNGLNLDMFQITLDRCKQLHKLVLESLDMNVDSSSVFLSLKIQNPLKHLVANGISIPFLVLSNKVCQTVEILEWFGTLRQTNLTTFARTIVLQSEPFLTNRKNPCFFKFEGYEFGNVKTFRAEDFSSGHFEPWLGTVLLCMKRLEVLDLLRVHDELLFNIGNGEEEQHFLLLHSLPIHTINLSGEVSFEVRNMSNLVCASVICPETFLRISHCPQLKFLRSYETSVIGLEDLPSLCAIECNDSQLDKFHPESISFLILYYPTNIPILPNLKTLFLLRGYEDEPLHISSQPSLEKVFLKWESIEAPELCIQNCPNLELIFVNPDLGDDDLCCVKAHNLPKLNTFYGRMNDVKRNDKYCRHIYWYLQFQNVPNIKQVFTQGTPVLECLDHSSSVVIDPIQKFYLSAAVRSNEYNVLANQYSVDGQLIQPYLRRGIVEVHQYLCSLLREIIGNYISSFSFYLEL